MTPKEKAIELMEKFSIDIRPFSEYGEWSNDVSKQCALICVNEYLSFQDALYITEGSLAYQYWIDVKKEIENYEQSKKE